MTDPNVGSTTNVAKISAIVFVVVVAIGIAVIFPTLIKLFEAEKVELVDGSVSESLRADEGTACVWTVAFAVHSPNRPEGHVWVVDADIPLPGSGPALPESQTDGRIFATFPGTVSYRIDPCPASVDDIDHGDLEITYRKKNQRSTKTVSFGM